MGAFSLCFIIYIIDLITGTRSRLAAELPCLCLTSETASFFWVSSRAIVSFSFDDWHRRHISNFNSNFILSRGKQLFKEFRYHKIYKKKIPESPLL